LQYKLWISEGKIQDLWTLEQRIETLQKDNKTLQQRNKALQAEVENLKTGLDVVEEKARQELGLIGKEETFFQFIEPADEK
ncbi:MAG: septum formation initiator family protein, partial [Cycloclasticus sp.]|nr:septum formation initiator family protein [Cycloclasticus sp.]MBQ0789104.1 septum formation initiator family protein [Cycloclasticus sp.]